MDGPADVVEEVARIHGFDAIPSTPLPRADGVAKQTATAAQLLERRLRRAAAAAGFHEAVTWRFVSEREAAPFGGCTWRLAHPRSGALNVMRSSLLPARLLPAAPNVPPG